jgi:hypothetical protein
MQFVSTLPLVVSVAYAFGNYLAARFRGVDAV